MIGYKWFSHKVHGFTRLFPDNAQSPKKRTQCPTLPEYSASAEHLR